MCEKPAWKKVPWESNAIGWIAFFLLVIGIGVGTVYFDANDSGPAKTATTSQGTK